MTQNEAQDQSRTDSAPEQPSAGHQEIFTADVERLSGIAGSGGLRVAVAESLTSGLLANAIGAGEGASEWFAGGIVAYMTDVKEHVLGLKPGTDPCSPECAEQLAVGARELFDADVCVSTTGVGGPDPEDGHAPGTVYLGWSSRKGVGHRRLDLKGGPEEVLDSTVGAAMRLLAARAEDISPAPADETERERP